MPSIYTNSRIYLVCGARYKTRPGLTYHYTHSHKEKTPQDEEGSLEGAPASPSTQKDKPQPPMPMPKDMVPGQMPGPGMQMPMNPGAMHGPPHGDPSNQGGPGGWGKFQDSYLTFLSGSPGKKYLLFSVLIECKKLSCNESHVLSTPMITVTS